MDFAILVLSIIFGGIFLENVLLKRRQNIQARLREDTNEVEKKLTELSIRQLKIKNDIDRAPLSDLVNRKRDGDNS